MTSQGPWFLVAQLVHRTPHPRAQIQTFDTTPSYKGFYNLSRNLQPQEDFLIMALTFSARSSPFTFSGSITLQWIDLDIFGSDKEDCKGSIDESNVRGVESGFQIHGSGLIIENGSCDEIFESNFQIAPNTGTAKYAGINGSGKLKVQLSTYEFNSSDLEEEAVPFGQSSETKSGRGECTFEHVNSAGISLA